MSAQMPSSLPTFTTPVSTATLAAQGHTALHQKDQDEILALATKVGVDGSAATTSLDYKLSGVTGGDKAASKSGVETLTNKTLNASTINSPTITTPNITAPSITNGGSWGGSPTITQPTIVQPTITTGGSWGGSPTITTPTIASFVNSPHNHLNAAGGGQLGAASVTPTMLATGATSTAVITAETTTSTTYTDLATSGPAATVTIGANGLALVILTCQSNNTANNSTTNMGFAMSGANTAVASVDAALTFQQAVGLNSQNFSGSWSVLLTGLNPGSTTFKAQYYVSAGTGTFLRRYISVLPL